MSVPISTPCVPGTETPARSLSHPLNIGYLPLNHSSNPAVKWRISQGRKRSLARSPPRMPNVQYHHTNTVYILYICREGCASETLARTLTSSAS